MRTRKRSCFVLLLVLSMLLFSFGYAPAATTDIYTDQTTTVFANGGNGVILHGINVGVTTGYGLSATAAGTVISGSADVSSGASGGYAVYANNNASIVLERANISAAGSDSAGVYANTGANVTITGNANITGVTGVTAANGGSANFGNVLSVDAGSRALRTTGSNSVISVGNDASIKVGISNNSTASTWGIDAAGAGSEVRVGDRLTLEAKGSASGAAVYANGGRIYISDDADITVHTAAGILANSAGSEIHIGDRLELYADEGSQNAVLARSGGKVYIAGEAVIGGAGYGIQAMNGTVEAGQRLNLNASIIGVHAGLSSSKITISNDASIRSGSYGFYSTDGAEIVVGKGLNLTVSEDSGLGVSAWYGGNVSLNGGNITMEGADALAVYAYGNPNIFQGATAAVTGSGVFGIAGDVYAGRLGSIDLTMDNGSRFIGAAAYLNSDRSSELTFTLNGADTVWNMTGNSGLTNLYMGGAAVDFEYSPAFTTLTVERLESPSGAGGIFIMKADIPSLSSDQIIVTNRNSTGHYDIKVLNKGSAPATGDEILTLAITAFGSSVSFDLINIVEHGAWQYGMNYEQGGIMPGSRAMDDEWQLKATGLASTPGTGAINSFAGSYLMAYADTQTLIQRMGDLRESPYGQGLWFRVHGGKFESNSKSYVRGFDMDYGGVQIGYDRKIENKWDGTLYAGIMFGYSKGDLDYSHEGSGGVDSKTLGIYGTYIARNGWYVDTILKYQWMTNDFDVIDTAGTLVRGHDVDTGGIGASVEIGKRIHVGDGKENKQGWYIEPQIQLSCQRQDGGYFNATNGLRIGVDSFSSLLGRVGILAGYETETTNLYAKVSKVKEFDGDLTIKANGINIPESFGDNWWVYGIGCTSRISDRNSLYFEIERTSGGSFSQPWRVFAGWRLEF